MVTLPSIFNIASRSYHSGKDDLPWFGWRDALERFYFVGRRMLVVLNEVRFGYLLTKWVIPAIQLPSSEDLDRYELKREPQIDERVLVIRKYRYIFPR